MASARIISRSDSISHTLGASLSNICALTSSSESIASISSAISGLCDIDRVIGGDATQLGNLGPKGVEGFP